VVADQKPETENGIKGGFPGAPGSLKNFQAGPLTALLFCFGGGIRGGKYCEKLLKDSCLTIVQISPNVVTNLRGGESEQIRF
jgi:hypothetical protein